MSDSYLAQWIAKIDTGHVITKDDMATLARIRMALDNADQHHRQARAAQAILAALREPSEAVKNAAFETWAMAGTDPFGTGMFRAAVAAAEREVNDGQP